MMPHLPRPARTPFITVARIVRRKSKAARLALAEKVKPKRLAHAFDALSLRTTVPVGAAPDSD
jgi:hypothetical protein